MKILIFLLMSISFIYSKEVFDIYKIKDGIFKSSALDTKFNFYHASVVKADFDLFIKPAPNIDKVTSKLKNPNVDDEQFVYQMLIDVFSAILKLYDIQNSRKVGFCFAQKSIWKNKVLVLDSKYIDKIKNRTFDEKDNTIARAKNTITPLYPLRKLFDHAKIYETHGKLVGDYHYSKAETKKFKEYLKKHIFQNTNQEFLVDEAYSNYFDTKKAIYECCLKGNMQCINDYIRYKYDINMINADGHTPLIAAVLGNQYDVVKFLIKQGADPDKTIKGYENAYLLAKRNGYSKIANYLKPLSKIVTNSVVTYKKQGIDTVLNTIDFVSVSAELGAMFSALTKNLQMSPSDPNAFIGEFKPNFSHARSGAIYKGINGIAGYYNYSFQSHDDKVICSGRIYVSGKKQNLRISVHRNCDDFGSGEF